MDMDRIQFPLREEDEERKEGDEERRREAGEERSSSVTPTVYWSRKAHSLTPDIIKTCVSVCMCVREWKMETEKHGK